MVVSVEKTQPGSFRELVSGAQFEALFHEHWERIFGLLFRLVGDRAEAEDLAVEVFLRLYHRPPRVRTAPQLRAWLYRVATNLGYNALRARKRRARYERQAGIEDLEGRAPADPAGEAERRERRERVRQVLARLKPRSVRLLVLRHSGLSYAEIAAILKLSASSIGTLLARAEREFESQYRQLWNEEGTHASD